MGRITTSIGLITGIPIEDTVNKLIALQARPRELLEAKNKQLSDRQVALTTLSARLLSMQLSAFSLRNTSLYNRRTATSSNNAALSASVAGSPGLGSYQFTPLQQVQSHQLLSSGVSSRTAALGGGELAVRFGGFIDSDIDLSLLNGGEGIQRGRIKIFDRAGGSSEIDLRFAKTMNDVLEAINGASVGVRAEVAGDSLRLIDLTGSTSANLRVEEVLGGQTAASLGLSGTDVAASEVTGTDVVRLFGGLNLAATNDGNGVRFDRFLDDLEITFRNGTTATVDFHRIASPGVKAVGVTTAANGVNAQLKFEAVTAGSSLHGVTVQFVDDPGVTAGSETVVYDDSDPENKTLTFHIDAGATRASHIITALAADETASALFKATSVANSSGNGLIAVSDQATLSVPTAQATTTGTLGPDSQIHIWAVGAGREFDEVTIRFVDGGPGTAGLEQAVYDDGDPTDKSLTITIEDGVSTVAQVIAAIEAEGTFRAEPVAGSGGTISVLDTAVTSGGAAVEPLSATNEVTLAEVLTALNAIAPEKLRAEIAPDGDRLLLTDLTTDTGGTFSVRSINNSRAAEDLGLVTDAVGDEITGFRLHGGLKSSLLRNLNGTLGLNELGGLSLTDRTGQVALVDLSLAETLHEVLEAVNTAGIGVRAEVNSARNGIVIRDTSGGTGNLVVSSTDPSQTAEQLGLAVDAAVASIDSKDRRLRMVSERTLLSALNGGAGVGRGTLTLTDSLGKKALLDLRSDSIQTLGDVITEIDRLALGIQARINDTGDGLLLVDTAAGDGTLSVTAGVSTTAADLHLLRAAETIDIEGEPHQAIDGSFTTRIVLDAAASLETLVEAINSSVRGVSAAIFNDGAGGSSFRLNLTSQRAGTAGALLVDASALGLSFEETVKAQDARLLFGGGETGGGVIASSSSNTFQNILDGLTVTVQAPSTTPVTVTVNSTISGVTSSMQSMVNAYNEVVNVIKSVTAYNTATNQSGPLQGDATVLRVETDLRDLFSRRVLDSGSINLASTLGISFNDTGVMQFDPGKLDAAYAADPQAVEQFFATTETGFAYRLERLVAQLAGSDNALLVNRMDSIAQTILSNGERIELLDARLDAQRQRLLNQFYRAEAIIGELQNSLAVATSLQALPPLQLNPRNAR